jgi:hypothetical protein
MAVALSLNVGHKVDREHVRDIADIFSGQDLNVIELDILTDMVMADIPVEVQS